MKTPKYVSKLKNFNIFTYELIQGMTPEQWREWDNGENVTEEQLKYVYEAGKDKAIKYGGSVGDLKKVPAGYPHYIVVKIDGDAYVVFMKHRIQFNVEY